MKRNYYLSKSGTLKRKDNSLNFIINGENHYIPIEDVDVIYILGELNLNSKLINFLSQNGVILHFFNYYGFYTGSFYPREKLNSGYLFVEQVKHYIDNEKRVEIAKEIINTASFNIHRNIRYYNERDKDLEIYIDEISKIRNKIEQCKTITEIMGEEGNIRKTYYKTFNTIINQDINFTKRVRRPPDNMINTLMSFVNTLIYTTVLGEIYHTQLSPVVSFLHEPGERRFSLSLDIAEVFKPLIGDRMIFYLLNKNIITEKDFVEEINYMYMKDGARKKILKEYDERLNKTIRHKKLKRDVTYKHLIRLELYKLVKHLSGEEEYDGFKIWW
ncbi:type I-B CRISPR-associated endonuclease Cas1b [Haliovirga abyssi]|uniref:type I-B CRISPR-associated endonuclease Cas1b n=1 Tax=Haliovirga abyssi TaxID=2996794 RepID=UPI0027DD1C41|nr:type I-B CRISPR-associated endonuclease Cas1b [Haliovirga abyssi]